MSEEADAASPGPETRRGTFRVQRKHSVGCVPGMPSDLSTNPAHFDGFGRD
jgi:hypothetical protein